METLIQLLLIGVSVGSIYAIIALGFVLVFKATGIFNFAQGNLMVAGAYIGYAFFTSSLPTAAAALLTLLSAGALGAVVHYGLFRKMVGMPLLTLIMATIGLALVIDAVLQIVFGPIGRNYPNILPNDVWIVEGIRISQHDVATIVVAAVCLLAFAAFFRLSPLGLQMRGTAEDLEASMLSGVNTNRVFVTTMVLAVILATVGGFLLVSSNTLSVSLADVAFFAVPAMVIGGLDSVPGAVIGGLIVGVVQQLGAGYISQSAQAVVVYAVLLIVLMARPYGLLGQREIVRM